MALPGHRRTSSHKRRRASHFALTKVQFIVCSNCGSPIKPHMACWNCGFYKGKLVFNTGKSLAGMKYAAAKVEKTEAKNTIKAEKVIKAKSVKTADKKSSTETVKK